MRNLQRESISIRYKNKILVIREEDVEVERDKTIRQKKAAKKLPLSIRRILKRGR
jgi:hypothetical protein